MLKNLGINIHGHTRYIFGFAYILGVIMNTET